MANRFPLVVDSSNQNIKELPDGDSLLLGDNEKLLLGDGTDLQLYHDGTHNYIDVATSDQDLIFKGTDGGSDITALTLDMSDAGTAIFNHDITLGDDSIAQFGASNDFKIYHNNGGFNQIEAANDHPIQIKTASENMIKAVPNGAVELYYNNVLRINTTTTGATTTGLHTSTQSANITQVAITSSSNAVAWDARAAANAYHVTTENTTFSAPSNATEGAIISVEIAQGGTARTVAWNTVFEFAASTAPVVTATANKTDIFAFRYNGSVWQEIGRVQNMAQT